MIQCKQIRHVVWLQSSFLGDLVLTTAALQLLQLELPNIKQHIITTEMGQLVFGGLPFIESIHVFKKSTFGILNEAARLRSYLKANGINRSNAVLLQPHLSIRSSILRILAFIPTITYEETSWSFFQTVRVPRISVFHECVRISLLLEPLGIDRAKLVKAKPYLTLKSDEQNNIISPKLDLISGRLIGIAPGSNWGTKRWPIDSYLNLINMILDTISNVTIVILGAKSEAGLCHELSAQVGDGTRLLNLAGETTLADLSGIYQRLDLLISGDSSPVHYASAFNVATIAIFGPTVPEMGFGPLADKSVVIETKGLSCRPCSLHGPEVCPLVHFKCMKLIEPQAVFDAVCRLIDTA